MAVFAAVSFNASVCEYTQNSTGEKKQKKISEKTIDKRDMI